MVNDRRRLGDVLVENRIIADYQLKAALADQNAFGGRLGSHLVRMGFLTEEALINVLAHQLSLPIINLTKSHIRTDALARVKKDVCSKHGLIPIARKAKNGVQTLLIAMSDPTDYQAIQTVEFASGCHVTVALALERDIFRAINFCYTDEGVRECVGERDLRGGITIDAPGNGEPAVILTSEGIEKNLTANQRENDSLRALVDLLVKKGVITEDEYRRAMAANRERH